MSFLDRSLSCADCRSVFVFGATEQMVLPSRCSPKHPERVSAVPRNGKTRR